MSGPNLAPCPEWCSLPDGHDWDTQEPPRRLHIADRFGGASGPQVEVAAEEYADEAEVRPMTVRVIDADGLYDPADVQFLATWITRAVEFVVENQGRQWWQSAPNPPCRSWCQEDHCDGEFAEGALMVCRRRIECEVAYVEVNASTSSDCTPGAKAGALVFDAPQVEVVAQSDTDMPSTWTPAGLMRMVAALPAAVSDAQRVIASDEHATAEQRGAVLA